MTATSYNMRMHRGLWWVALILTLGLGLSAAVFDTQAAESWDEPALASLCDREDVGDQPIAIAAPATDAARPLAGGVSRSRGLQDANAALPDAPASAAMTVSRGGPQDAASVIVPTLRC